MLTIIFLTNCKEYDSCENLLTENKL